MGMKWTNELFSKRINLLFPRWEHEIIEYNGFKKPLIIKCLNCGEIIKLEQASRLFSRLNPCRCIKMFNTYVDRLLYLGRTFSFQIDNLETLRTAKVITTCLKCGAQQIRTSQAITLTPYHCPGCSNHKDSELSISLEEARARLDKLSTKYTLLEYSGITKSALLKHECGFIFKTNKLNELISGHNKGCPKCFSSKSKGEQRIEAFLNKMKISFISQKTFLPAGKKYYYRFDFFLPDSNIAIEYQGEQHFRDNGFTKEGLDAIQERDAIKREYCQQNKIHLIEIPYTSLHNIEEKLSSRLNDYGINTSSQV